MINKKVANAQEALHDVQDNQTIMVGGFGLSGIPENSIAELVRKNVTGLTCISNNAGVDDFGLGLLLQKRQIKKMIASYVGENAEFERQMLSGELDVELTPQGTLAERVRAGGAGLGGELSPTGIGTIIEEGKKLIEVDGKEFILEKPLRADVAFIKGSIGDKLGNLVYIGTTQNFNPLMATAADLVIAEVDTLKEIGEIEPERVHTPSIFVDYIVQ